MHLDRDEILEALLDGRELSRNDAVHLSECTSCREMERGLRELVDVSRIAGEQRRTRLVLQGEGCPDEGVISRYIMNELSSKARQRFESHLASCDACLHLLSEIVKEDLGDMPLWERSSDLRPQEGRTTASLGRSIRSLLDGLSDFFNPEGWRFPSAALSAASAAVVAVFFVLGLSSPPDFEYEVNLASYSRVRGPVTISLESGDLVYPGERFQIRFRPDDGMFLYVVNVSNGGDAGLLFPHPRIDIPHSLEGAKHYSLPAENGYWKVDGNSGTETVFLLGSENEVNDVGSIIDEIRKISADGAPWLERAERIERFLEKRFSTVKIFELNHG